MTVIKIDSFGGEMPSVSPRALPANAAQINSNLFLASPEFRPLMQDEAIGTAAADTKTLHRLHGSTTWISSTQERSYVKGQVNDEKTERTYLTADDGSATPRAIDNAGADRTLGVYRPAKPAVALVATDEITQDEANTLLYGTVAEGVRKAVAGAWIDPGANEPNARYESTQIKAGPYEMHGLSFAASTSLFGPRSFWGLQAYVSAERAAAINLDFERLGARVIGGLSSNGAYVPLTALPFTILPNTTQLSGALRLIQFPQGYGAKSGSQFFSDAKIASMVSELSDALSPNKLVKSERDELDALAKEFYTLLTTQAVASTTTKPTQPTKPTVGEYDYDTNGNSTRAAVWVAYDAAMLKYQEDLAAYNESKTDSAMTTTALNNRVAEIQARAAILTKQVESTYTAKRDEISASTTWVSDWLGRNGGVAEFIGDTVERIIDTRFYVVTFVTDWGEESAPSEPSDMLEVDQNDKVTLTRPNSVAVGSNLAAANIQKWRIYRSNAGSNTAAFQLVDEVLTSVTSYTDARKAAELGEVCPTTTWEPPPYRADLQSSVYPFPAVGANPYLRGLVGMPNGIMAGFFDNTVAFCEPYIPYAWPVEYQITTEYPVVGLGVFGQTLFVGTTGNPYFISGADSASMSAQKLDSNQACASRRSIVAVQGGVLYASPDGLCAADPSGVQVISSGVFTREDWQKLQPASMFAATHENLYYLWYVGAGGGCLVFDLATKKLGRVDLSATATFVDKQSDTLFAVTGSSIVSVFGGSTRRTAKWKTPRTTLPQQTGLAWLKVLGDQDATNPVTVRWYGDGTLRHTATITSIEPVRLPAGRWLEHEVEVESRARITQVMLASSTQEMQAV